MLSISKVIRNLNFKNWQNIFIKMNKNKGETYMVQIKIIKFRDVSGKVF